ncbi:MAG: alpha/beta fold hydrolase [Nitriliruptorales bacterium]
MRARLPDVEGYVEHEGVKVAYEVFGDGDPTILLLPTWMIVHSRVWKMQVACLARHFRVVTFDAPGNGRSDRPTDPAAYGVERLGAHAREVLDATGTERSARSSPTVRSSVSGAGAAPGGGASSTSPLRSASDTRSATSRSRRSCAGSTPTSRSTGSPSTR